MEAIGMLLVLASFFAFIFGVVNVIYPLKALRIHKRLIGLFIILGSMAGCMAGGVLGVAGSPGGWEKAMTDGAAAEKAGTAAKAEKATPPKKANLTQAELNALWADVLGTMTGCDEAVTATGKTMEGGDVYASYSMATRARNVCEAAWQRMGDVQLPASADGDVKKAGEKMKDECEMSLFLKRQAMIAVSKVLDGDARPSRVQAATEDMQTASSSTMMCVISFAAMAQEAGLEFAQEE